MVKKPLTTINSHFIVVISKEKSFFFYFFFDGFIWYIRGHLLNEFFHVKHLCVAGTDLSLLHFSGVVWFWDTLSLELAVPYHGTSTCQLRSYELGRGI